jgi:polyadenylate-binding protein
MNTTPYASGSLYVGDLHPDVSESVLYDVFREVGPIVSIRVCRDSITRKSLGYGYVNFQNPADAELALDTLNYTAVNGVPMRIMWSQRDPSVRKSGIGNVFIKNLDKSIDNKALYDTFSAFGNILSCKVETENVKVKNEQGEEEVVVQSNGYGFVHFETQEAAEQAIAKVNNMLLNGKQVYVGPFIRRGERLKVISSDSQFTNIFIKNLDKSTDEEKLRDIFGRFGEIQSAVIMKDDKSGSKGFAFVNFTDHESAAKCVEDMNDADVAGKKLYVGRAQKKVERQAQLRDKYERMKQERMTKYQGVNIYVKNLDDTVDDDRLRIEFEKFGEITSAKIMRDEKGTSKGFGFVCFTSPDDANKAIVEMSNKMVGTKPLYCAFAQRKDQRRQQLEQQYSRRPIVPGPQMAPMGFPQGGPPMGFYPPPGMVPNMPNQRPPTGYPYPQMGGAIKHQPRWFPQNQQGGGRGFPGPQPTMVGGPQNLPQQPTYAQVGRNAPQGRGRGAPQGKQQPNVVVANQQQGGAPHNRQNARGGAYKFAPNARNRPQNEVQNAPQPIHQQSPQQPEDDVFNSENLADLPESKQKNILGERLYPLVERVQPDLAPKITGMLLDMEVSDIIHLIEAPDALSNKINEAVEVLEKHARTEQAQEE